MRTILFSFTLLLFIVSSCRKENETYPGATLDDYYPLQTGKYISYKLDSVVYLNFGTTEAVVSYEVKYLVDSVITDNLGRPGYRVFCFIRKTPAQPWEPSGTIAVVKTENSVELIENNLRYIKLVSPLKDMYSWKGNAFIDTWSLNSAHKYLDGWDYTYAAVGEPEILGAFNLENTLTVQQADESFGSINSLYSEVNFSEEKYAKGIGLIYKKFLHREYQGNGSGGFVADGSYGVTLTMIDHN